MNDIIAALVELQSIDDEISGFQKSRDELAGNLDRLRTILDKMGAELSDKQEKLSEASKFYSDKSTDLKTDAERMTEAKSKLAGVTRTKEYAAMQRELDNLRKKYSEDEAELARLAKAIEEYNTSIAAENSKLSELQTEVNREQAAHADRLGELDGQISKIDGKKTTVVARLQPSMVNRYKRILKAREGKAVVPVVQGRCTGCSMMLPPQTYILVQRGEVLQSCNNCQRYLFYDAEIAARLAT